MIRIAIRFMDLRGSRTSLEIDTPIGVSNLLQEEWRKDIRLGRAAGISGPGAEGRQPDGR